MPAFANSGAHSKEVLPPAEKIAILGAISTACLRLIIVYVLFKKLIFFPTEFSEATRYSSSKYNFRSLITSSTTPPTIPVAPTKAIFIQSIFLAKIIISYESKTHYCFVSLM